MKRACPVGFRGVHSFYPRYDSEIVANVTVDNDEYGARNILRHVSLPTRYVYDICTKCGAVQERKGFD